MNQSETRIASGGYVC